MRDQTTPRLQPSNTAKTYIYGQCLILLFCQPHVRTIYKTETHTHASNTPGVQINSPATRTPERNGCRDTSQPRPCPGSWGAPGRLRARLALPRAAGSSAGPGHGTSRAEAATRRAAAPRSHPCFPVPSRLLRSPRSLGCPRTAAPKGRAAPAAGPAPQDDDDAGPARRRELPSGRAGVAVPRRVPPPVTHAAPPRRPRVPGRRGRAPPAPSTPTPPPSPPAAARAPRRAVMASSRGRGWAAPEERGAVKGAWLQRQGAWPRRRFPTRGH